MLTNGREEAFIFVISSKRDLNASEIIGITGILRTVTDTGFVGKGVEGMIWSTAESAPSYQKASAVWILVYLKVAVLAPRTVWKRVNI